MADITQKISNFPPAPNSQTDTPPEFNSKADAFVHHQSDTYVAEVNTWATQANAIKNEINTITASIPNGTINDGTVSTSSVWSSNKVSKELTITSGGDISTGIWTKFPDGTMITIAMVDGAGFALSVPKYYKFNYPVHYVGTPVITVTVERPASDNYEIFARIGDNNNYWGTTIAHNGTEVLGCAFNITVIGRWK